MTDTRPDLAAIKDGRWLAHGEWVAEYCAEQSDEPEPLFRVQPEANAATVARIHNDLLGEVDQLRSAVSALVEAQRHFPADDDEFCWHCEKPWPCPAEQAAENAKWAVLSTGTAPDA